MKKIRIAYALPLCLIGVSLVGPSAFAQRYTISTVAGQAGIPGWSGDGGAALNAQFLSPQVVALDAKGDIYIADNGSFSIRRVDAATNLVSSVAGNGKFGFAGDGGAAAFGASQLNTVTDLAFDSNGNLYIADLGNARVRKVDTNGIITTFAGNGTHGFSGDGGPANQAALFFPSGLAVDSSNNVYIADSGNGTVRKVTPSGTISTVAGNGTQSPFTFLGEGKQANAVSLNEPNAIHFDPAGNLYFLDIGYSRLLRIDSSGVLHTVYLNINATSFAIDASDTVYLPMPTTNTIQKIIPTGTYLWIGGNGFAGFAGDGGFGTDASINTARGITLDSAGNVYVADTDNAAIRKLTVAPNTIGAIHNAASEQGFVPQTAAGSSTKPIVPGEFVVLFGQNIGPATMTTNTVTNGFFSTSLAGVSVTFNGTPAPMIWASQNAVCAIVPYEVAGSSTAAVQLKNNNVTFGGFTAPVGKSEPGIFTSDMSGSGQAAVLNVVGMNASINSPNNPAHVGNFVVVYATGEGATAPGGTDGEINPAGQTPPAPIATVTASIGDNTAPVAYAGGVQTLVQGVLQVNVQIPSTVSPSQQVPLEIVVNGVSSQITTIAVVP